jgi:hypothetical protein
MSDTIRMPEIEMLAVSSFEELGAKMQRATPWFTMFLLWESPNTEIEFLAKRLRPLVDNGLVYLCAWGPGCEEMHDAIDQIVTEREQAGCCLSATVMSTSHPDESLGDALWYFNTQAVPDDPEVFANFSRYAVAIGSEESSRRLKQALIRQGISGRDVS